MNVTLVSLFWRCFARGYEECFVYACRVLFFRGDDGMCLVSLASLGVSMFGLGGWRGFSMMVCALATSLRPDRIEIVPCNIYRVMRVLFAESCPGSQGRSLRGPLSVTFFRFPAGI